MSRVDFRQTVTEALAAEIAKKAVGVLALACGAAAAWLFSVGSPGLSRTAWPLGIVAVVGAAMVGLVVARRRSIYKCRYPAVSFQIEVIEKHCSYIINDHDELIYRKRIKFKALRDQVDEYIDRYHWTAGGAPVPLPGEGVQEITKVSRVGTWEYYRVFFGRVLHRGDIHEIEMIWPPLTNWRESSPFVALSTREPTHKLVFEVKLPVDEAGGPVLAEMLAGIDSIYSFSTDEVPIEHGCGRWQVDRPALYTKYRLRWTWTGAQTKTVPMLVREAKAAEAAVPTSDLSRGTVLSNRYLV